MKQRTILNRCRISGKEAERNAIAEAIDKRQRKHKRVTVLQAELQVVVNDILRMEMGR